MELLPDRDSLCFRESKKIQVCLFKKTDEKSSLQNELYAKNLLAKFSLKRLFNGNKEASYSKFC